MLTALIMAAALASGAPENPNPLHPNEEAVDPYTQADANAGAKPFAGDAMWKAFHGQAGVDRVVDETVDLSLKDPRIKEIFESHDMVRLRRTLKEQFCYILNGGCSYSGRDMKSSHKDLGVQNTDFNILVEHLQAAMDREKIGFRNQNRFLAKLAPMQRDAVER
jgi:hemoglobin